MRPSTWESTRDAYRALGKFILKFTEGKPEQIRPPVKGGYNVVLRLEYKDVTSVIMRVPINAKLSINVIVANPTRQRPLSR